MRAIILGCVGLLVCPLFAEACDITSAEEGADSPPAASSPTEEQVAQWVADLNAPAYAARQEALASLAEAKTAALAPLVETLASGDLETVFRIYEIFQDWILSGDEELESQTWDALEQIIDQDFSPDIKKQASEILDLATDNRRTRGRERFMRLGADFVNVSMHNGTYLRHFRTLVIDHHWTGEAADFELLKWFAGDTIEGVSFSGENITNEYMPHLAHLSLLTYLELKNTSVTAEGLDSYSEPQKIAFLKIHFAPMGDEAVESLERYIYLYEMTFTGPMFSEEGKERIQAAFPTKTIHFARGGHLGINIGTHAQGCIIGNVIPGSAADTAELQANDIITQVNEEAIDSSETLVEVIKQYAPGDQVKVHYLREGQACEADVTLGRDE